MLVRLKRGREGKEREGLGIGVENVFENEGRVGRSRGIWRQNGNNRREELFVFSEFTASICVVI